MASHGAAPDLAGKGLANPIAMILSSAMLLRWLADRRELPELRKAGAAIDRAVSAALDNGVVTSDLGGRASTAEFSAAVTQHLPAELSREPLK